MPDFLLEIGLEEIPARMIANGSTEEHAHAVMAERHRRREARRAEQQDSLPTSAG